MPEILIRSHLKESLSKMAVARALAIGKELMHAEEPEKESEDEYGTIEIDEVD